MATSNVPRMNLKNKNVYYSAPCKDCPDRKVGCHSSCQKYKDFKKVLIADNRKRLDAYAHERLVENYTIESKTRTKKRNGRKPRD